MGSQQSGNCRLVLIGRLRGQECQQKRIIEKVGTAVDGESQYFNGTEKGPQRFTNKRDTGGPEPRRTIVVSLEDYLVFPRNRVDEIKKQG